jgi:hypothetical protein
MLKYTLYHLSYQVAIYLRRLCNVYAFRLLVTVYIIFFPSHLTTLPDDSISQICAKCSHIRRWASFLFPGLHPTFYQFMLPGNQRRSVHVNHDSQASALKNEKQKRILLTWYSK